MIYHFTGGDGSRVSIQTQEWGIRVLIWDCGGVDLGHVKTKDVPVSPAAVKTVTVSGGGDPCNPK